MSAGFAMGTMSVATETLSSDSRASTSVSIAAGTTSGSSPCTLRKISSPSRTEVAATSAMRSVPERCSARVMTASAPNAVAACTTRSSSVAIITREILLALLARSHTRWIIGLPASTTRTFPGKRVEAKRAGMIAMAMKSIRMFGQAARLNTKMLPQEESKRNLDGFQAGSHLASILKVNKLSQNTI